MRVINLPATVIVLAMAAGTVPGSAADGGDDAAAVQEAFETAVAALNAGNLDGFLDSVHEEALSFHACGPTSGKQGREACALSRFAISAGSAGRMP
jgi:hypothetical protein